MPGPDEPGGTDFGPETGHWDMDAEDDPDGDGTATWDGPMVWQDDEQGGTWDRDAGLAEGSGTWEADVPPTMYGAWGAGPGRPRTATRAATRPAMRHRGKRHWGPTPTMGAPPDGVDRRPRWRAKA